MMSVLQLLKPKTIFSIIFVGLFALCFPFHANAQVNIPPQISVLALKVDGINGNQIKGTFNVWNTEKYFLSDLGYEINLIKDTNLTRNTSVGQLRVLATIDTVIPNETLIVPPGQTINRSFTYQYPKNIASGEYTLRVRAITGRGIELGWDDQLVTLQGANNFLETDYASPAVLVNGVQSPAMTGVNVSPNDAVAVFFRVTNPGDAITVIPSVKIFNRALNMPVFKEYQDSSITIASGKTEEIQLKMPKTDTAESYLAEVNLYKDGAQVVATQYFRWVVEGIGGKIIYLKADKDFFNAGENLNLTIETTGPPENITPANASDIGTATLEITVSDKDGNFVAKASKNIVSDDSVVFSEIAIPIKQDLVSPEIDVKLVRNLKVLDERTINLPMFSAQAQQIEKAQTDQENFNKFLIYLALAVFLVIILIVAFLIFKPKAKKK